MSREILFCSDFRLGYHNLEAETKMARFAERGYRVHYVEHLGIRNPSPRHALRLARALHPSAGRNAAARPFEIVSPKLLPPRHVPLVDALNRRWLARQLLGRVEDPAATALWTRFPVPELLPLVERRDWRAVVYELVDDHPFAPVRSERHRRLMRRTERRILERAGVVFAWSEPIRERLAELHANVVLAPAAVDLDAFARPARAAAGSTRSVACYAGSFDSRLDGELMLELARTLPAWRFVLAGELTHSLRERMLQLPNLRTLGQVPADEVPGMLASADVCLMPYRVNSWTDKLFPIKLIEYLAAGKPVVSTPIRAARDFADVVTLASGGDEFAQAVAAAAETDSPEARARRVERARPFSWDRRIDEMQGAIERSVG